MTRAPWALVSTPPREPKTARVRRIVDELGARGLRVAGFVQQRLPDAPRSYELVRLGADDRAPVARRGTTPGPEEEPFCNCVFRPDGFTAARAWLDADLPDGDVVVLDEISRLEATGGGHAAAVEAALARAPVVVLSVRADRLAALMERFGLPEPIATVEADDDVPALVAAVAEAARPARAHPPG